MIAAAFPYDMPPALHDLVAPRKKGSAIGCPSHLEQARYALHSFHPEPWAKAVLPACLYRYQVSNEARQRVEEPSLLLFRQTVKIANERRRLFVGGHPTSSALVRFVDSRTQELEKRFASLEEHRPASRVVACKVSDHARTRFDIGQRAIIGVNRWTWRHQNLFAHTYPNDTTRHHGGHG